jgi:sugar (pentulose or hexulose) kinase
MSFIGIDLGATYIKGAWLNPTTGQLSCVIREPFPAFLPGLQSGHREVSSKAILSSITALIEKLFAAQSRKCAGIFICGQMHGFILRNLDGSKTTNFISWQDSRCFEKNSAGFSYFDLAKERLNSLLSSHLGNEFRPGLPITTLYALLCKEELSRGFMPLSLMDFVASILTGATPQTHLTNAAAHGFFDFTRGDWSYEALKILGLEILELPKIQDEIIPVGRFKYGKSHIPVYLPIGDQQAALLGASLEIGELSINVATGSQVSSIADNPLMGRWQLRPYLNGKWLRTITHLPAGRALNRLVNLCGELAADQGTPLRNPWSQISRLTEAALPQALKVDLSFFPTAYGDQGAFTHILEDEINVGSFFRAAFRAMAENYEKSAHSVSPKGWSRVVFSGGLVQKLPILQSEILARLGESYRVTENSEDALAGLLALSRKI